MLTSADLDQFTGTENHYKHWTGRILYTDGVKYLADTAEAHWLLDAIASYQYLPRVKKEPFQLWVLKIKDESAVLTMQSDSDKKPIVTQKIEFTDFPLAEIKLYVCNGVILLPSEY
jgi:hypothetical protein